jgi:hypothetical protein
MKKLLKILNSLNCIVLFILCFSSGEAFSQSEIIAPQPAPTAPTSSTEKIIYEYKKEDYFDFEALSVKGDLLTPGDLSGKAVKRVKFNSKEYIRKNFDDFIEDDLMEIY